MKKTILKSLLLGAAALTALTASAENKLIIDDFEIAPGATTKEIAVYVQNDDQVFSSFQFELAPIPGLTFKNAIYPEDAEQIAVEIDDHWPKKANGRAVVIDPAYNTLEDGTFRVVMTHQTVVPIAGTDQSYIAPFTTGQGILCVLTLETTPDFKGGQIVCTFAKGDYSDPVKPEWVGSFEFENQVVCNVTIPIEPTPLATIVAEGVNDNEYVVADPLYVVTKSDKAHCVFVTDGPVSEDNPTKGNWMKIYAEGDVYNAIADMEIIKEGTLKGVLSEASGNQQLTVTTAPTEGEPDGSLKVEPKEWNLAQDIPGSDDWHFAPKVNEVIALTGYWQDNAFSGYLNNGGQVVTASMAWCDTEIEMVSNGLYQNVVSAVQLKPTNGSKAESDLPYTKYIIYPTTVEDDNVVTGVENLKGDKAVVSVQYVNVAGQVANTPFQGVNMVVTRYADGSTVTTKVIK